MKLKNPPKPRYKTTICRENLMRCIFRFTKEFGCFSAYLRGMNKKMTKADKSLCSIYYNSVFALSRISFPDGGGYWDMIHALWVEWAKSEDNIGEHTLVI